MKKNILIIAITLLCSVGCTDYVKEAQTHFTKEVPNKLSEEIKFFNKTITFYKYSVPENYWYPKDYTLKQIMVVDELRLAIRKLEKLDAEISAIPPYNNKISAVIKKLKKSIKKNYQDFKEKQRDIREIKNTNPYLLSLILVMTPNDKRKFLPKDIKKGILSLQEEIEKIYWQDVSHNLFKFEYLFLKSNSIKDIETKVKIREVAKNVMRKNLLADTTNLDTVFAKNIINTIYENIPTTTLLKPNKTYEYSSIEEIGDCASDFTIRIDKNGKDFTGEWEVSCWDGNTYSSGGEKEKITGQIEGQTLVGNIAQRSFFEIDFIKNGEIAYFFSTNHIKDGTNFCDDYLTKYKLSPSQKSR